MPGSGVAEGWRPSGFCVILLCDVESFSDQRRSDAAREIVRAAMYGAVATALAAVGVGLDDPAGCYHEDRGDGVMVVLPADVAIDPLLTTAMDAFRVEVRRHNAVSAEVARMRLRLAMHRGDVRADGRGLNGSALIHAFRLLEARELKDALAAAPTGLALIISDEVYGGVVREGHGKADPGDYRAVVIAVKETSATAWIMVPGVRPEAQVAADPEARLARTGPEPSAPDDVAGQQKVDPGVELAAGLLAIGWLRGEQNRDRLVGELPLDIAGSIPRSADARSDVLAIVRTCMDYPGGLGELHRVVRLFVGGSLPVLALEQTIARMLTEES